MKRGTCTWTLLCLVWTAVWAQDAAPDYRPQTELGLRSGLTLGRLNTAPSSAQRFLPGMASGLIFRHFEQRNLGVQLELNFAQRGWGENIEGPDSYERRLSYVEVPFYTMIGFGRRGFRVYLSAGTFVSYLLGEQENARVTDPANAREYFGRRVENPVDYGLGGGLGIRLPVMGQVLAVEGRFHQSFGQLFTTLDNRTLNTNSQAVTLSVAYLWHWPGR